MSNLRCVCGHWEDSHVIVKMNDNMTERMVCYQCECEGFTVSAVESAVQEWADEAHRKMYEENTMKEQPVKENSDLPTKECMEQGCCDAREEGKKFDGDKLRLDLVPTVLLRGVAWILTFGAKKYGDRNWEQGILYHRVWGALLRHLMAWYDGEELDPESGKPHLWHAACNVSFLMHFEENKERYEKFDDRPINS